MTISICIPSYNRPHTIFRLLNSIDENCKNDIEVIICEDNSPKRNEIREEVEIFKKKSSLTIRYIENSQNLGYDRNLRELISHSKGEFILFMGDDDYFFKENLEKYIEFLKSNRGLGYVLKTWINLHDNKWEEVFNYFPKTTFFTPSEATFASLFRNSTFISGFIIKKEYCLPYLIDKFDGTLLFQLYILGEITLKYPSAYCEIPLTIQTKTKVDVPHFGSSESEKKLYTPGKITIENSITFLKGYFKISNYLDHKYQLNTSDMVKKDMSKYSYSYLYLHRDKGVKKFYKYYRLLKKDIGLNKTLHIDIYFLALLLFGGKNCNNFIFLIKKIIQKSL